MMGPDEVVTVEVNAEALLHEVAAKARKIYESSHAAEIQLGALEQMERVAMTLASIEKDQRDRA